jgi:hypothetical protein
LFSAPSESSALHVRRVAARDGRAIELEARLVRRDDARADQLVVVVGERAWIHAQQSVEVEFHAQVHWQRQALVKQQLERFDLRLQRLVVIVLVERVDVVERGLAHAQLVQRHVEASRHVFDGPAQLLDELRVARGNGHGLVLEAVAEHCDLADVAGGEVRLPMQFETLRGFVFDDALGALSTCRWARGSCSEESAELP